MDASDQQPSWNAPTSVWQAIEGALARISPPSAPEVDIVPGTAATPLPERGFSGPWPTQQGDKVEVGDLVALRLRYRPGGLSTKGRIVRGAGKDAVECVLGDFEDNRDRPRITVEVDNLVMLLRKAGGGDPIDAKRL